MCVCVYVNIIKASIEDGKAEIKATFAKKEDLGTFFKTFAKPKELLQTTMSLACGLLLNLPLSCPSLFLAP